MLWGWFTYYFTKEGPGYRVVKWCSQDLQLGSGKAKAHPQFSIRTPFLLVMLCWLLLLHNCCKMSFTAWVFGALIRWSILRRKGRGSFQEGLPEILRKDGVWGWKLAWLRSPRKHLFPLWTPAPSWHLKVWLPWDKCTGTSAWGLVFLMVSLAGAVGRYPHQYAQTRRASLGVTPANRWVSPQDTAQRLPQIHRAGEDFLGGRWEADWHDLA